MLTTLNNLTFDSLILLSVQRNLMLHRICSIFNYHKELSCGPVSIKSILLTNALPSPTTPYSLYAHSAIRDAQCRKAAALGGCAEANPYSNPFSRKGQSVSQTKFDFLPWDPPRSSIFFPISESAEANSHAGQDLPESHRGVLPLFSRVCPSTAGTQRIFLALLPCAALL
jgi:hypothetical protein